MSKSQMPNPETTAALAESVQDATPRARNAIMRAHLDANHPVPSQLEAQISALHRALMRRVQEDNCCRATGVDCNVRVGGMFCSCSRKAQDEIEVEAFVKRNC